MLPVPPSSDPPDASASDASASNASALDASPAAYGGPSPGQLAIAVVAVSVVLMGALGAAGHLDSVAQGALARLSVLARGAASDTSSRGPAALPTFRTHDRHPEVMHSAYLGTSVFTDSSSSQFQFQQLLDVFEKRLGVDDNFTVRVLDNRTNKTLEVYVLKGARAAYGRGRRVAWRVVDRQRRTATKRLVKKWWDRGVPREHITVKWGRAHQVAEAYERDRPYVEYELRLAEHLGLSTLPTEIGTVETFNQDDLVSRVGARSRYQMMPNFLRRFGIYQYRLSAGDGRTVHVREERHPLLTMEAAFTILRGYTNAVGHEIPGISAYHTGPSNIYHVYQLFFTKSNRYRPGASVMDAYMWAVTDGFEAVREASTFGPYSRGYVASAYGALKAVEGRPVDTTQTLRAVRVQLKPGRATTLGTVLAALDGTDLDWGYGTDGLPLYDRFRQMNPHFDLPATAAATASGDLAALPASGDVHLPTRAQGHPVRFFLPLGAPAVLARAGLDVLDPDEAFRFDDRTFATDPAAVTEWDRAYDKLVKAVEHFGFTPAHRKRLFAIHEQFKTLAVEAPTPYRLRQLRIAELHRLTWTTRQWSELSERAVLATGRVPMPTEPPVPLDLPPLPSLTLRNGALP